MSAKEMPALWEERQCKLGRAARLREHGRCVEGLEVLMGLKNR